MKNKIKVVLLILTIMITSLPFSGITANAGSYVYELDYLSSTNYEREAEWDLYDDFIRYDLCITDYESLSEEKKELCEFIFETERSAEFTIRCERARRTIAGDLTNEERITIEEVENAETYLIPHEFGDFAVNLCFDNYIPDIVYPDSDMNGYEYWIDDEGKERITHVDGLGAYVYVKFTDESDPDINYVLPDYQCLIYKELELKEAVSENLIEYEGNYYIINSDNTVSLLRNNTSADFNAAPDPVEETIIIPEEINGYPVKRIEACAFQYSGATKVVIPDTVTHIGDWAFDSSLHLTEINIPESLEYLGEGAFANCSSLMKTKIDCPELILKEYTFFCAGLNYADINVKSIKKNAFEGNPLTKLILYEGIESIEANAFLNCTNLTEINIPSTLEYIGQGAFEGTAIGEINIPDTVEIIGTFPFRTGKYSGGIGAFPATDPLTDEPVCVFDADCIINGWYNTEAHRYALEWGLKFNPMDEDVSYGDTNLDGDINVADMVLLQSYLTGKNTSIGYEADIAKDGIVDSFDMIKMRKTLSSELN